MQRLLAIGLLVTACGVSQDTSGQATASACDATFAAAAAVNQMADSVSDLYPAIRACSTLAEWSAVFAARGGAGFTGTATEVLRNACGAAEVANEPLRKSVE
jgi:hypothetical protein